MKATGIKSQSWKVTITPRLLLNIILAYSEREANLDPPAFAYSENSVVEVYMIDDCSEREIVVEVEEK